MKLGIDALDIVQINGLVEEHLVEGRGEPDIPRFSSDSRGALFANDIVAVEKAPTRRRCSDRGRRQ